ncbi:hypothetical protein FKW77_003389 [Venturia effusa]|uniref:Uncharacterized protein n=1 Tax=Venturia effusa TaxID=50376 RepID=A0A517KW17_9PEZI|nr:hypothetical protein FKW77_003389 [Venturia effusa]
MSKNANGKRPVGSQNHGESSNTKRTRSNRSFSPETLQGAPPEPAPVAQSPYQQVPDTKPDIGMKAFLNDYLATHTASDPLFRRSITTFVEDRFDYEGIDYADQLLVDIKAKGGHHPDMRAVQIISDEELSFKWARLLMSLTLDAGNLPTIMRYIGTIAAERYGVRLNDNFETAIQSFLIQVGHTPIVANNASAQRQMSVMPVDHAPSPGSSHQNHASVDRSNDDNQEEADHEEDGNDATDISTSTAGGCTRYHYCLCSGEQRRLPPSMSREERLELFKSATPTLDLLLGGHVELETEYVAMKRQRTKMLTNMRNRARRLKFHKLSMTGHEISELAFSNDPWVGDLVQALKKPAQVRRQEVEKVLHRFARSNRCLFPDLRRFDQKKGVVKKERA